ncbi:LysM peptidoglycan-binding domain-containing M23 family metallopeptidase [Neorhizobium galegae]|uniref:LysM peptidoglycan-binding domain-containing M23 family metallopeptidase n=1 Tax=Neorhizobium galegae TaxID=399 RepID=UPI001AE5B65C|nr:LysM peptidoglycan-binding domain-containing M23 family metallopeptidase [Neorhizobium galegae]
MRLNSSSNMRKSAVRVAVAAFLASAATGCSSDATRFSGLMPGSDDMTTASIPQRQGAGAYGPAPMPQDDVGGYASASPQPSGGYAQQPSYPQAQQQTYPQQGGYGSASASPARRAAAPVAIQRAELAPPTDSVASRPPAREDLSRQQAMVQPAPAAAARPAAGGERAPGAPQAGWSTVNAPRIAMRPGETAATLSQRYGVPEKEILKANGGTLTAGQMVIIPTYAERSNPARVASGQIDLPSDGKLPKPARDQGDKVAVLPGAQTSRDKTQADAGKLTPPSGGGQPVPPKGGSYVVKPGDTLAKIARATNTPIDRLKADNGLSDGGIRVGQTLKVANGGEAVKPAAAQPAAPAKVEAVSVPAHEAAAAKAPEKPAHTQTASLSDVESKSDVSTPAPSATGIDKYRWPVNGAVIAAYGSNVDGNRNDGIDISVPEGTPIKAAENGVVIYAGNGLKQLGNTVLVRHDDGKVTVYGHAGNINVSRGQKVQRGQTLATSGMSGDAKRPQVHFEVRKDATPVNPMTFLE